MLFYLLTFNLSFAMVTLPHLFFHHFTSHLFVLHHHPATTIIGLKTPSVHIHLQSTLVTYLYIHWAEYHILSQTIAVTINNCTICQVVHQPETISTNPIN